MYEMNEIWKEFYEELEPQVREEIYASIIEENGNVGSYVKTLMNKRYHNPKDPENRYPFDLFLQQCVVLPMVYKRRRVFFFNVKKQAKLSLAALTLDVEHTEAEKEALYWEFRNTAKRYFTTCQGAMYGRSMFGTKMASSSEKRSMMLQDAWRMSKGIGKISGMEEQFMLFSQAVRDELEATHRGMGKQFDNYSEK